MSESYRAIYDAALQAFDISFARDAIRDEAFRVLSEYQRPSAIFRPTLSADGNMWCALLGEDLQSGVAGFGETPEQAMTNFDIAFLNERAPAAQRAA